MNGKHAPGTLLLASSRCPFCGSPMEVYEVDERHCCSDGVVYWVGGCSSRRIGVKCDVLPEVTKSTREEAIAAICRRAK